MAVKRIWDNVKLEEKFEKEFLAEILILGTIQHSNIVKLLYCISSKTLKLDIATSKTLKLLVYEYMENRSLDRWLHSTNRSYNSQLQSTMLQLELLKVSPICTITAQHQLSIEM